MPDRDDVLPAADSSVVGARRVLFASLTVATFTAMIALGAAALAPGGIGAVDLVLLALFAVTLPWTVIGFWNAVIGFLVMRFSYDPVGAVLPAASRVDPTAPITSRVAILVCVRNERPSRILLALHPMMEGLVALGLGERMHVHVLSDTDDQAIAATEEAQFGALAEEWAGRLPVTYRRRLVNEGFKAGNIADFCNRHGASHDLAVTLDADSVMPAEAIARMVRVMEADRKIGILQGLVIARPATSAFARLFQYSMRLAMRSYTFGSAWWQADCGPYWGHNAVIRLAPFATHCELSALSDGGPHAGHVLSHDQIEAVLMRRAGHEVRVLPEETLGFEDNPPTLLEFIRRDLRWCRGNMQYWRFLDLPGLRPLSRYQLAFAILMFLGSPAWIGLLVVGALAVAAAGAPSDVVDPVAGAWFLGVLLPMWYAPQLATLLAVITDRAEAARFGGRLALLAGTLTSLVFMQLLLPIMWIGHMLALVVMPFGRTVTWTAQARDDHAITPLDAWGALKPQTAVGVGVLGLLAATHPAALPYAALLAAGPALAVPFAIATASPAAGLLLRRLHLARLPEEIVTPPILVAVGTPGHDARETPPREAAVPGEPAPVRVTHR